MRVIALLLSFYAAGSARVVKRRESVTSRAWTTQMDTDHGLCAANMGRINDQPLAVPLLCSGEATNVKITGRASGWGWNSKMSLKVDGADKGEMTFPAWGATFEVTLDKLSQGLHSLQFRKTGSTGLNFWNLEVEGAGMACSLEETPSLTRDLGSYTLNGLDVLNRLFGEDVGFSQFKKKQLNFATETMGTNADGSISSTVISEGWWQWFYQYSQNSPTRDRWGNNPDGLWEEAQLGHKTISLGHMPRHVGQNMDVMEPCNTLSNLAFGEAAVWSSCKDWPFDQDEKASIVASFSSLAAGSAFLHACGCQTGGRADTFTMDWLMLQTYQSMTRDVLDAAGDRLTAEEKNTVLYFDKNIGSATDLAKDLNRLFSGKYDHEFWNATIRGFDVPAYEFPIMGVITFVLWSMENKFPVPGLDWVLKQVIEGLLGIFGLKETAWVMDVYTPALRKALGFTRICSDAVMPLLEHTLKFIVTFVEALVFQEAKIPVPKAVRDIFGFFDQLGFSSDLFGEMDVTWDYYNGHNCRARSDHASWHEKAAQGLIHFLDVAEIFRTPGNLCDS